MNQYSQDMACISHEYVTNSLKKGQGNRKTLNDPERNLTLVLHSSEHG